MRSAVDGVQLDLRHHELRPTELRRVRERLPARQLLQRGGVRVCPPPHVLRRSLRRYDDGRGQLRCLRNRMHAPADLSERCVRADRRRLRHRNGKESVYTAGTLYVCARSRTPPTLSHGASLRRAVLGTSNHNETPGLPLHSHVHAPHAHEQPTGLVAPGLRMGSREITRADNGRDR